MEQIELYEKELEETEERAANLKGQIGRLKEKHEKSIVLKWRDEIRGCMRHFEGYYILVTPAQVVSCIEYKNSIVATRDIKNKVATTLSLMRKEGEVGRFESEDGNYYGHSSLFNKNLKILKHEFKRLLNKQA